MTEKEIYIIRHGETAFNKMKIVQGSGVDSSLNEMGEWQAKRFFEHYKNEGFEKVIVSELKRTFETALPFIEAQIPYEKEGLIDEMNWGVYEGKAATEEMHKAYGELNKEWQAGNYDAKIEGGESANSLKDRLCKFIEKIKSIEERKILVVSHGRAMRCLMCILDKKEVKYMMQYPHSNTGLYKIELVKNDFLIVRSNDTSHLK